MNDESGLSLPRPEECPSELRLDRCFHRELPESEERSIRAHLESCSFCRGRFELRSKGFAALPAFDVDAAIHHIAAAAPRSIWKPSRFVPALAAAAALLLVVINLPIRDDVTAKGAIGLRVYRERDGRVEEMISGDRFRAGDRLRFRVSLPDDPSGEIMILGIEKDGIVSTYYPAGSDRSARPEIKPDGALAGAIQLDDHPGEERLLLYYCPRKFLREEVSAAAPKGCSKAEFLVNK